MENIFRQFYYCWHRLGLSPPGLLIRPEHSETNAKTEIRECETEIETETRNML